MAPTSVNPLAALENIAKKIKTLEASNIHENGEPSTPVTDELLEVIKDLQDGKGPWVLRRAPPRPARRSKWTGTSLNVLLAKVGGTYELLEKILSFTEHQTLLNARGVSRYFRDLIDRSITLQHRLFLLLCPAGGSHVRVLEVIPNGQSMRPPAGDGSDEDDDSSNDAESVFNDEAIQRLLTDDDFRHDDDLSAIGAFQTNLSKSVQRYKLPDELICKPEGFSILMDM